MRNLSFFSRSAEWFDNQLFCDQAGSGKMSHAANQIRPDNGNNSSFVIVRNTEFLLFLHEVCREGVFVKLDFFSHS